MAKLGSPTSFPTASILSSSSTLLPISSNSSAVKSFVWMTREVGVLSAKSQYAAESSMVLLITQTFASSPIALKNIEKKFTLVEDFYLKMLIQNSFITITNFVNLLLYFRAAVFSLKNISLCALFANRTFQQRANILKQ